MTKKYFCPKCKDAGWLWGSELYDYYNDDSSSDDTHYSCDECSDVPLPGTVFRNENWIFDEVLTVLVISVEHINDGQAIWFMTTLDDHGITDKYIFDNSDHECWKEIIKGDEL
jgi:hypothetical protein